MLLESVAAAVILAGANYTDYASSRAAIGRGGVEVNVLYGQGGERLLPVKVAVVAAETFAFHKIRKHHKKTAWAFVATVAAVNVALARRNDRVLR